MIEEEINWRWLGRGTLLAALVGLIYWLAFRDGVAVIAALTGGVVAGGLGLVLMGVLLIPYLLPAIVADLRGHQSAIAIGIFNVAFGWTAVGWILALVWAFTATGRSNS